MPVNANSGEYKSRIGLDSLYIAEVTQDDALGYVADTPEYLAPAAEATLEPTTSLDVQYADDQPYDVMSSEAETKITLKITDVPAEMEAKLTGGVFDAASGRLFDNASIPPDVALSFRSLKSNGSYRYYQFLKGKFSKPKEEMVTKGEKAEPKTLSLEFTAVKTIYKFDLGSVTDGVKRIKGDEDTDNFDGADWFDQVQTPVVSAPSALSLSSSTPADAATGVSVSANQTLTFNNALVSSGANGVTLIKASDASVVAGTKSLDATKKIVTIDPTSNLDASTDYIIVYAVTDIYGQTLNGAINFTTA